jgi:two-component system cell cycle sensor histidine kinase/response regulator CckA
MSTSLDAIDSVRNGHDLARTILLVEDHDAVRKLAIAVLENEGYRVLEASDASAALEQAQAYPEKIDALLTDIMLPGVNGNELADSISAARPGIKVLFLSGYTEDIVEEHLSFQDTRFLQKPFTPAGLVQEVWQLLSHPSEG